MSRAWRWFAAAAGIVVLDQVTKVLVLGAFAPGERMTITSFLNLVLVFNKGAAFSFLADAAGWWPLFPVRKLALDRWTDRVREISLCKYLGRVSDLILRGDEVDVHAARALVASPHMANVRRLVITRASHEAVLLLRGHFGDRLIRLF